MGYALPYIVMVLAGAVALGGVMALWVPVRTQRDMGFYLFLGIGLQFLICTPVALVQGALVMGPRTPAQVNSSLNPAAARQEQTQPQGRIASQPPPLRMALAVAAMPIQMGGWTTRTFFELVDGDLRRPHKGYPSSAIASGVSLTVIASLQALGMAWILGRWIRPTGQLRNRRVQIWAAIILLNSLLNIAWPWWGS